MKILITGGAGLVGSHCAEHFAEKGDDVVVLDNLSRSQLFGCDKESVEYNWNYLSNYKNIKRIRGDVRDIEDINVAMINGVDAVIHAAGQPGVPSSVRMPTEDFHINAFGTFNVLERLRKVNPKAKFIYCSTNKVYGENIDDIPLREKRTRYVYKIGKGVNEWTPVDLTGHTPYGVSKLVGDLYTQEYSHIYGMRTAVFRMSCTYGARQFGFEDQGWVAWFIIANLLHKEITIYGDGKQVRDLLYVTDLVNAFDKFINSDVKSGVFNIGGGSKNTRSLLEFIEDIEWFTGHKTDSKFSDWRPSDQKVYITDISYAKKALSWKPKVDVREGIMKVMDWVKRNISIFK